MTTKNKKPEKKMPKRANKKRAKRAKDHDKWEKERVQSAKKKEDEEAADKMMDVETPMSELNDLEHAIKSDDDSDVDLKGMDIDKMTLKVKAATMKRAVKIRKRTASEKATKFNDRMAQRLEKQDQRQRRRELLKK